MFLWNSFFGSYKKFLFITSIILLSSLIMISCATSQSVQADSKSSEPARQSELRPYNEPITVDTFITTAGNPTIAVYKFKLTPGVTDEWAQVVFWGFEAASRIANDDSILAVGVIYTDGKSEGYFITQQDYIDFKNKQITNEEFVNKIRKKDLSEQ